MNYATGPKDVIRASGIIPPSQIIPDGKIHRFSTDGKRDNKAGWYKLYGDGIPAGSFGDWRTNTSQTWRADIGRKLTPEEEDTNRKRIATIQRERKAVETKLHEEGKIKANEVWNKAIPATEHPYLTNKGIKPYDARVISGDKLVIPLYSDSGEICSLQFIDQSGNKKFLGYVAINYWFLLTL